MSQRNSSVQRVPFVFDQSVYYFVQNLGVAIVKSCCRVLTTKAVKHMGSSDMTQKVQIPLTFHAWPHAFNEPINDQRFGGCYSLSVVLLIDIHVRRGGCCINIVSSEVGN